MDLICRKCQERTTVPGPLKLGLMVECRCGARYRLRRKATPPSDRGLYTSASALLEQRHEAPAPVARADDDDAPTLFYRPQEQHADPPFGDIQSWREKDSRPNLQAPIQQLRFTSLLPKPPPPPPPLLSRLTDEESHLRWPTDGLPWQRHASAASGSLRRGAGPLAPVMPYRERELPLVTHDDAKPPSVRPLAFNLTAVPKQRARYWPQLVWAGAIASAAALLIEVAWRGPESDATVTAPAVNDSPVAVGWSAQSAATHAVAETPAMAPIVTQAEKTVGKEPPGGPEAVAPFSFAAAQRSMSEAAVQVNLCALPGSPSGNGVAHITFAPSGRIVDAEIATQEFRDSGIAHCIREKFLNAAPLAPFTGGAVLASKAFYVPARRTH